ncbi:MAG: hypothetical protein AAF004_09105 [Pseudomonadota bacterium]
MSPDTAALVSAALLAYLAIGVAFSVLFVAFVIDRIDPAARGASLGVRLLLVPGAVLVWPLLVWRWMRSPNGIPAERTPHKQRAAAIQDHTP